MKRDLMTVAAALLLCGCAAGPVRMPAEGIESHALGQSQISNFLESKVHAAVYQLRFQRDSTGSKLYMTFYFRKGNEPEYRTVVVTNGGTRQLSAWPIVWYDDHEKPLFRLEGGKEWYEGEGRSSRFFSRWDDSRYVFEGGAFVSYSELQALSSVRGVVGHKVVLIQLRNKPWIVSTPASPRQAVLELPDSFQPQAAYSDTGRLILFDTYRPQGGNFARRCLIYQKTDTGYQLASDIPIKWMGGVFDMWAKTNEALIEAVNDRHMYATYYRFNVATQKRSLVGLVPADDVLFLRPGVIQTLEGSKTGVRD